MSRPPSSSSRAQRNTKEQNRRKHMKDLIGKLSSLIPPQASKPLSLPEKLERATSYIMQLQKNEESLKKRRALLREEHQERMNNLTAAGSYSARILPIMNITSSDSILEVNLICGSMNRNFMLHEIISVLQDEGAEVINATQLNAGDKVIYIIKSKAIVSRIGIETARVQERIKQLVL